MYPYFFLFIYLASVILCIWLFADKDSNDEQESRFLLTLS